MLLPVLADLDGEDGDDPDAPFVPQTGPVDLTAYSGGWLRLPQQVLDVLDPAVDGSSLDGWRAYQHNGSAFLLLPSGMANPGSRWWPPATTSPWSTGSTQLEGPTADEDEVDADVMYAAAFAHAELWRIARDRLEAVAAEGGRPPSGGGAEATRLAVANAPWLFAPGQIRKDRVGPLWGLQGARGRTAPRGLRNGPRQRAPTAMRPSRSGYAVTGRCRR